ncbi:glucose-6-phosphate dehydrogenase [Acidihalobacter ferrooxydans]|uniref:Glucose-6-phosphate 1-dehydrogenase n=1 Tax=Acidihalobacter ferrooxydans TaxID=1765967 RepID=A0A1P8UHL2_9GAMM|nr:glucose-6-phosphate dehydrogenase [Acidihalobacter ferrooxydans]APZ43326.1 glucose-6-phosphate dehydrogenase [Acidihalobacter ferrooxydans]
MKTQPVRNPFSFVLFGAGGDLAWRLVVPALFALFRKGHLPERFQLLGVDRVDYDRASFGNHLAQSFGDQTPEAWSAFCEHVDYVNADFLDHAAYGRLDDRLKTGESEFGDQTERVFYLATPPTLFAPIAERLGQAGLAEPRERTRLVVEKPLGRDLASFRTINASLTQSFTEEQVYRIDHFLGKETVQNILALRFANPLFEPVWNRNYIDHVAITVAESLGVENRAGYYEHAGALRDMVQNHLMQLLCLVAMEPPVAYDANDIRNRKMDVMHALRPIVPEHVQELSARGQYGAGWIAGDKVPGYRQEPNVDPDSETETYAALKLHIDNWRWQDVPFYLRTGKRMPAKISEISIRFKPVPHHAFPAWADHENQPVRLTLQIQPDEAIRLRFMVKEPGMQLRLRPADLVFNYADDFRGESPSAYETLLYEVLVGDASLFMRADQVEAAWKLVQPVLDVWAASPASDFPNYAAGSWGPETAEMLTARDSRSWLTPAAARDS